MSRLSAEALHRAKLVLSFAHCPTPDCECTTCVAGQTILAYERLVRLLDDNRAPEFGDNVWKPRIEHALARR